MKSGSVCAMKHLPGDGIDEHDQHQSASVNTYSKEAPGHAAHLYRRRL